jgi:hypothetical protein
MPSCDQCPIYVAAERNSMDALYGQGKKSFSANSGDDINE